MMTDAKRRFPILLTLFVAACVVFLCALGTWQVQRMGWKEGLIAEAEAAARTPPQPLAAVLAAADPEFRKATFVCPASFPSGGSFMRFQRTRVAAALTTVLGIGGVLALAATPTLTVMYPRLLPALGTSSARTASRIASATFKASSSSVSGSTTANSSPP